MTKFMINNRTGAWKTDVNLLNFTLNTVSVQLSGVTHPVKILYTACHYIPQKERGDKRGFSPLSQFFQLKSLNDQLPVGLIAQLVEHFTSIE